MSKCTGMVEVLARWGYDNLVDVSIARSCVMPKFHDLLVEKTNDGQAKWAKTNVTVYTSDDESLSFKWVVVTSSGEVFILSEDGWGGPATNYEEQVIGWDRMEMEARAVVTDQLGYDFPVWYLKLDGVDFVHGHRVDEWGTSTNYNPSRNLIAEIVTAIKRT